MTTTQSLGTSGKVRKGIPGSTSWPQRLTILLALVFFFPLYWAIVGSLKRPEELQVIPPLLYPPVPQWSNFVQVGQVIPFFRYVWNTAVITVLGMIGGVVSASLVAYGFACFRFRGRNTLFLILLGTMILPGEVTLIPTFVLFVKYLGWGNTIKPLVIPTYFGGGAFSIFLFRQFFASIPKDLNDAAKIDGCSPIRYYLRILMPLSVPVIITLCILWFQYACERPDGPADLPHRPRKVHGDHRAAGAAQHAGWHLQPARPGYGSPADGRVADRHDALADHLFRLQRYFIKGVIMTGIKG